MKKNRDLHFHDNLGTSILGAPASMNETIGQIRRETFFQSKINLRRKTELFRSQVLFKSLDAAITAPLRPTQSIFKYVQAILNPGSSNYERVASVINLINKLIPGTSQQLSDYLCSTARIPFKVRCIQLMSYGSGSTVFLLNTVDELKVLKIYRRSLGRSGESLFKIAKEFKNKYETVSSWYNEEFNLVPPAIFFILHGPVFGSPAAAVLQPYIHGEKKDFFMDFEDEELIELLQKDGNLKEQFFSFARKTLQIHLQQGRYVDFIGKDNLMLVREGKNYHLLVIDNGIFDLEQIRNTSPELFSKIEAHIFRLRTLLSLLGDG